MSDYHRCGFNDVNTKENPMRRVFQFGIRNAHLLVGASAASRVDNGGADGTRTRDPRRDRPVF